MSKDNVLTLLVPGSNLIFTRYLYIKDEVQIALTLSILNKDEYPDADFWASELLFSGFEHELFALIWKIYYDFFATLNPTFILYLIKKHTAYFTTKDPHIISEIINNLSIRPSNTDVFFQRQICELFVGESIIIESIDELNEKLNDWFKVQDYRSVATFILNNKNEHIEDIEILNCVLQIFKITDNAKYPLNSDSVGAQFVNEKIILLASVLSIVSQEKGLVKKKQFFLVLQTDHILKYQTICPSSSKKSYRILSSVCSYKIDKPFLNLFKLARQKVTDLQDKYNIGWLYHASFSPVWFERIRKCKGYIDYVRNKVLFIDDNWEETFYEEYGLEPDEQAQNVKDNCIGDITGDNTWKQFYTKYKRNSIIIMDDDELDALNDEPLMY